MIKEIHIFGTSFSDGGGFHWLTPQDKKELDKFYTEEPKTQQHYSWPGQMRKYFGSNVKIINHAKCGYGNERIYRLAYDIIMDGNINDKIFIFEFSSIFRKEIWSNEHNKFLICNYTLDKNKNVKVEDVKYDYNHPSDFTTDYRKVKTLMQTYLNETFNHIVYLDKVDRNLTFFVDFLFERGVNFKILEHFGWNYGGRRNLKKHMIKLYDKEPGLWEWIERNNLTIWSETNGHIKDGHPSLEASKLIAKIVSENIKEKPI